jgi:hypothetical protein
MLKTVSLLLGMSASLNANAQIEGSARLYCLETLDHCGVTAIQGTEEILVAPQDYANKLGEAANLRAYGVSKHEWNSIKGELADLDVLFVESEPTISWTITPFVESKNSGGGSKGQGSGSNNSNNGNKNGSGNTVSGNGSNNGSGNGSGNVIIIALPGSTIITQPALPAKGDTED